MSGTACESSLVGKNKMMHRLHARHLTVAPLVASGLFLAGCMGSPTYGTNKTASEQLFDDVTNIVSIAPKRGPAIDYKPRGELVRPAKGEAAVASAPALPAPQQSVVASAGSEAWPESPEARRKRLRDEATANQENGDYDSPLVNDVAAKRTGQIPASRRYDRSFFGAPEGDAAQQRAAFNKRLAETKQGSPDTRRYLSEPPVTYRAAEATAPSGDVGEDEWKKERRQKAESRKKGSWRDILPW